MRDTRLSRFLARPPVIGAMFVMIVVNGCIFANHELAPRIESVFSGPDPETCQRAEQTHAPRAIALCCAAESAPPRAVCEGTAAERRREAEDAESLGRYEEARQRWEERAPSHYRYSFQVSCFPCPGFSGFTFTSEVTRGVPVLVATGEGQWGTPPHLAGAKRFATMDAVFDAVEAGITRSQYSGVEYDRHWDYPRGFSWGSLYVSDAITTFEVIDFEVLP